MKSNTSCRMREAGTATSSGSEGRANWRKSFTIRSRRMISSAMTPASSFGGHGQGFFQAEEAEFNGGQGIADFMGHAGCQHAERGQLFLAGNDGLAFAQLMAQRRNHSAIRQ